MDELYELLEVKNTATPAEIKKSYRFARARRAS
jgi:curved DNA-binding protein CbpA